MKTIFALIFLLSLSGSAHSQIVPKTRTLGGNLNASFRSRDANGTLNNTFQFGIQPVIGKFLNDKWLLETRAFYGYSDIKFLNSNATESAFRSWSHAVGIGIGFTRSFPVSEKLYLTLGANLSTISIFNNFEDEENNVNRNQDLGFSTGVSPGMMFFLTERWIMSAQFGALQYQFASRIDGNLTNHAFGFQFSSFASSIGVRYVLSPKRKRVD